MTKAEALQEIRGTLAGTPYDEAIKTLLLDQSYHNDQHSGMGILPAVTPYVTKTATGSAFSGPCELAGYICTVAAGTITVYDGTSAAGTVLIPTTTLAVGSFPILGPGTNGKVACTSGVWVVLSGGATVNMLVG